MPEFVRAMAIDEWVPGKGKKVSLQGKEIALFQIDGCFYAVDHQCPHRQGPLSEGTVEAGIVTCPWHGWRFELSSGACKMNPLMKIGVYPTKIENGAVFVQI